MSNAESDGFWISISDLMSGLMVIFLFIAIAYMYEIQDIMQGVIYITEGFEDTEKSLFNELNREFKNDLENLTQIINNKGTIFCDDYDLTYAPGVKEAIDKYVLEKNFNLKILYSGRFAEITKHHL